MKSSFSRNFFSSVIVLLTAMLSVGLLFQLLAGNVMKKKTVEQLHTEAQTVADLVVAYHNHRTITLPDLYINLSVISNVSGADTVVCNSAGKLILCSDAPMGCSHLGAQLNRNYVQYVLRSGGVQDVTRLTGLYEQKRYIVALPIYDTLGNPLGIVISSRPVTESGTFLTTMTEFYLISAVITLLIAVLAMGWLARKLSSPLIKLQKAAVDFGHGNLDARVELNGSHPEEIEELALAFNNMAQSLQYSEHRRQDFVANVSHELKTPMTTIAGFADGILDGTIPPEKQRHYLLLISEETKRLNRLVRSMLDAARLQETEGVPEEQKQRFDVTECAGQVLISFEQKINEKQLNVDVKMPDHPVYAWAQQDGIVQVLYNLVDNAVKFCPQAGLLELTVRTGGNKIYVSVANSGKTIPQEELALLFERFHKLDKSRSENRDSWGLGLYIVKTIIGAHGENISVVSRDERTEFTFTLPLVN